MSLTLDKHGHLKQRECGKDGVQNAVRDAFIAYGAEVHRLQAGGARFGGRTYRLSKKGTPDLIAVWPGLTVYLETKTKTGALNPDQIACHAELRRKGFMVLVPRGVEDALVWLRENAPRGGRR